MEILHKPSIEIQDAGSSPPTSNEEEAGKESGPTNCPTKDTVDTKPEEGAFAVSDWTHPLLAYLINSDLPTDKNEAQQIVCRSKAYTVINGELYKRSLTSIFQQCVSEEGGSAAIEKVPRHSKKVKVVIGARRAQPNPRLGVIHPSFHPQPTEKSCSKLKLIQIENTQTTMLLWF